MRYNNPNEDDRQNAREYSRYAQEKRADGAAYAGAAQKREEPGRKTARRMQIPALIALGILAAVLVIILIVVPANQKRGAARSESLLRSEGKLNGEEADSAWNGYVYEDELVGIPGTGVAAGIEKAGGRKGSAGADAGKGAPGSGADPGAAAAQEEQKEPEGQEAQDAPKETGAEIDFAPAPTANTMPDRLIAETGIEVNGTVLEDEAAFSPWYQMDFHYPQTYTDVEGVITFRGDNFRSDPTYGRANLKDKTIESLWNHATGGLTYGNATWTGSGWTGQPLMVKWPAHTKAAMNMYDWAREKDDLVEVIYACMDGFVYFLDLVTGEETRKPLYLGWTFKGAGALDPRGYPILYLGAGYNSANGTSRVFIINLLDCSVMYEFGNNDPFSLRGSLSFFDASALVDASSDTLIYPGESGILYLIHLNTVCDLSAGKVSIDPDQVAKWHYQGTRTNSAAYWVGMETSPAIYKGYMFIADNGGNLMCMDLNTLQLVWVADTLDDSNSTPVLSVEDGHLYIYVSTSFHYGWRAFDTATVPVWKIDAENGEVIWQHDYECRTQDGVSGGVQSTIALGKNALADCIYVTVSRTGGFEQGVLACLDRKTGETKWEHGSVYAWSSPACIYDGEGNGWVIYCDGGGKMFLLDGLTGGIYDSFVLSEGVIEASPAVYDNYVVVGTRACKIWGLKLG